METSITTMPNQINNIDLGGEKRKKAEDLSLIREMLGEYESMVSNHMILTNEDKIRFSQLEESEKTLERELQDIDKMLATFIEAAKDARRKSSDILDTGKGVNLDFSGEKGAIKASKGREIKTRRNATMMKNDIEVLITLRKEVIKAKNIKSREALFSVLFPDRHFDNAGKNERALLDQALLTFWKGI